MVVITCFSFISILLNGMNIKHWLAAPQYTVRRILSICAFNQTRCAFGQLDKPNYKTNANTIASALHD